MGLANFWKNNLSAACLMAMLLLLLSSATAYGHGGSKKHVLILNSYHPQYAWSANQSRGASEYLSGEFDDLEIYVEYMDSKRFTHAEHNANLARSYRQKYEGLTIDAIVTTDDNALDFVMRHHAGVFQSAPVAFSGVNNYDPNVIRNEDGFTGTAGTFDTGPTFEVAFKLHPQVKTVYVVVDTTPTGLGMRRQIAKTAARLSGYRFEFLTSDDYTTPQLLEKLRGIGTESMVLMTVWFRDKDGAYHSYGEATRLVAEASSGPVYGIVRTQLGHGIVGGQLIDGYTHGQKAGQTAARFLRGEKPADIAITTVNFNPYLFDGEQLERWGIKSSQLPTGSVLINERANWLGLYYGRAALAAVVVLVLLVMFQMVAMAARRRSEARLRISEQRHRELFETMRQGVVYQDAVGKIISVNPAAVEILGVDESEMHQRDSNDPRWQTVDENEQPIPGVDHPAMVALRTGERVSDVVMGIYNPVKNGRRWIMVSAVPLFKDGENKPYQVYATITDITERQETERALTEAQAILRTSFDAMPIGLVIARKDEGILHTVNAAAMEMLGKVAGDRVAVDEITKVWEIRHPDGRFYEQGELPLVRAMVNAKVTKNQPMIIRRRNDGQEIYSLVNAAPVHDADGKVMAGVVIFPNITELKNAEQALKDSEMKYRALIENSPDIIMRFDRDYRHVFVSRTIMQLTGMKAEDFIGKTHREMGFDEKEVSLWENQIEKVFTTGQPIDNEIEFDGIEGQVIMNWRLVPEFGEAGQVNTVLSISSDITEQRKAQQDYEYLFNQMIDGFAVHEIVYDETGKAIDYRFLAVNPAFERMTGLKADEVVGKTVLEVMPDTEKHWIETYAKVAETGDPFFFENYSQSIDKYFNVVAFRPRPHQFACSFEDVTARKKAEAERERLLEETEAKNAELERFTYTVSHDLKSPLITIKGYLGMIDRDISNGAYQSVCEDLGRIGKAADRMHSLLDELLELSRVGRLENPAEPMHLSQVAREAAELVAGQINARGVEVVIDDGLPTITGDRPRMLEVFQNLLDNAVKYMGDREDGKIEVGVRNGEARPVLFVKDNGKGINPEYHDKVFGLFDQLDTSVGGTGIGLALVKRIIEVHGGRVWVESQGLDKGSTFCFTVGDEAVVSGA